MSGTSEIRESPPALAEVVVRLFVGTGSPGVHARTALHQTVCDALDALITTHRPEAAQSFRFPPVLRRVDLERSGYVKSFPHLVGCVFAADDRAPEVDRALSAGAEWTDSLGAADLVLAPAACYPVYSMLEGSRVGPRALAFDVCCDCFRREPSSLPDRLQSFQMREFVMVGEASEVLAFRQGWLETARQLAESLGLPAEIALAHDPFFGREGTMLGVSQRQQSLKFELLVPTWSRQKPTACMSFNYHRDHFGTIWSIRDGGGAPAHTACVAFGMDRLVLALCCTHGAALRAWPDRVRHQLQL